MSSHQGGGSYGADPYGTGADHYGADHYGADPHAAGSQPAGTGPPGTRSDFLSSGPDPYAVAPDPYAAGPDPSSAAPEPSTPGPYGGGAIQSQGAPYGGPASYGVYPPPPPTSGSATAGLVLGILALTICSGLTAPFGIVFAAKGMQETAPGATPPRGGRGSAVAGLVLSLIGMIPFLLIVGYLVLIVVVILADSGSW